MFWDECICGTTTSKHCAKCKEPYCGTTCQTFDWPVHRNLCGSNLTPYDRVLGGEILVPSGQEPNVSFHWQKVNGIVGRLEKENGKAQHVFVNVWANLPNLTIYFESMSRYGRAKLIIQWKRSNQIWTYDPEFRREIFRRGSMQESDTDVLKIVDDRA